MTEQTSQRIKALARDLAPDLRAWINRNPNAPAGCVYERLSDRCVAKLEEAVGTGVKGLIDLVGEDLAEFLYAELPRDAWDEIGFDQPTGSVCLWFAVRAALEHEVCELVGFAPPLGR